MTVDVLATAFRVAQFIAIFIVGFAVLGFVGLIFVEVIAWRRQRFFMRAGTDDPIEELASALAYDGKPALTWVVRWSRSNREPVYAAWQASYSVMAMKRLLALSARRDLELLATAAYSRFDRKMWPWLVASPCDAVRRAVPVPPTLRDLLVTCRARRIPGDN